MSDAPSSHGYERNGGMRTPRSQTEGTSRVTSASAERPVSVLSMLSNATWTSEKSDEINYLQLVN